MEFDQAGKLEFGQVDKQDSRQVDRLGSGQEGKAIQVGKVAVSLVRIDLGTTVRRKVRAGTAGLRKAATQCRDLEASCRGLA